MASLPVKFLRLISRIGPAVALVLALALAEAGFAVDAMEEWPSLRMSQPGPNAAEENRARREIPMFLAIRAVLL